MSLQFLEVITSFKSVHKNSGMYYVSSNPQIVDIPPSKVSDWESKYFFVKINAKLVPIDSVDIARRDLNEYPS